MALPNYLHKLDPYVQLPTSQLSLRNEQVIVRIPGASQNLISCVAMTPNVPVTNDGHLLVMCHQNVPASALIHWPHTLADLPDDVAYWQPELALATFGAIAFGGPIVRSKYSYASYIGRLGAAAAVAAFAAYEGTGAALGGAFPAAYVDPQAGRHAGAACACVCGVDLAE